MLQKIYCARVALLSALLLLALAITSRSANAVPCPAGGLDCTVYNVSGTLGDPINTSMSGQIWVQNDGPFVGSINAADIVAGGVHWVENGLQFYMPGLEGLVLTHHFNDPPSLIPNYYFEFWLDRASLQAGTGSALSNFTASYGDCGNHYCYSGAFTGSGYASPAGSPAPLPAALPLFATGLAGLGLLARRKKKPVA